MKYVVVWTHNYQDCHESGCFVVENLKDALQSAERLAKPSPSVTTDVQIFELGKEIKLDIKIVPEEVQVVKSQKAIVRVKK